MDSARLSLFTRLGLSEKEAILYEFLLSSGRAKVRDIVETLHIGRVHAYLVLNQLIEKKLVTVIEGKQRIFEAVDPEQLHELAHAIQKKMLLMSHELDETLPQLRSLYRLGSGKPHIRYFEGLEGIKIAIQDSLTTTKDICTILDVTSFHGIIAEANRMHVEERIQKKIHKRILVADTPEAHAFFSSLPRLYTNVRFLPKYPQGFSAVTEIYDDTVAFFTLEKKNAIAALITDVHIAATQRAQFNYLWDGAEGS